MSAPSSDQFVAPDPSRVFEAGSCFGTSGHSRRSGVDKQVYWKVWRGTVPPPLAHADVQPGDFFVHKSVKTRMERMPKYKPRAENWDDRQPVYVD